MLVIMDVKCHAAKHVTSYPQLLFLRATSRAENTKSEHTLHGIYVYSTLALEKERELVKEETALRKEYAVMLYKDAYNRKYIQAAATA